MTCHYPHCGCLQPGGPGPCESRVIQHPLFGETHWQRLSDNEAVLTPFSPKRERHNSVLMSNWFWRRMHVRADMRDYGNPGSDWQGADGYCLDRYTLPDFQEDTSA